MYTFRIFDSITEECKKIWKDDRNKFSLTFFQDIQYIEEVIKNKNNQINYILLNGIGNSLIKGFVPEEISDFLAHV